MVAAAAVAVLRASPMDRDVRLPKLNSVACPLHIAARSGDVGKAAKVPQSLTLAPRVLAMPSSMTYERWVYVQP